MSRRAFRFLIVAVALGALAPAFVRSVRAEPGSPRTVLAVYFSTEDSPANPVHDAGIREGLLSGSDIPVDYFTEYLESDRFPAEQASLALHDYLQQKYRGRRIDLVLAVTDTALKFVLCYRNELFPDAPIVYFGNVVVADDIRRQRGGITGVVVGAGFRETLGLALKLHPSTERTFVVAQPGNIALQDSVRSELQQIAKGRVTFIAAESIPQLIDAVKAVPPRSVILYIRHSREEPGKVLFASEVARLVAAASPVPVYGVSDSDIGSGVVGGAVYVTRAIGVRLGQMAREILDGKGAQDIPVERATVVPVFDWRQMQRWGIRDSQLPAGSAILYRQPGAWQQYRLYFVGAGVLVILQSAFIAALLIQQSRRVRAQRALGESEERFRFIANRANEAAAALREERERYAAATAAGAVGVWDWNLETSEIYVDSTLKSILGFEDAEITSRADDWGSRVHPLDVAMVTAEAEACIDGRIDEYEVEHRMIHKDGSARWFLSRGSLVRRADGTPHRMVGTKVDITGRKIAETSVRENEAVLKATNREMQDLAGRLIVAQEAERARIARDLHDDLSQQLAGLSIALSGLKRRIGTLMGAGELQDDVSSLQRRAVGLAENIRHLSHDLHPSVLEHAGLVAALAAHCTEVQRQEIVQITFTSDGDFTATSPDTALCLYRVAQEALRNVVTHADARHAEIQLCRTGDRAELTIADDGKGFDIIRADKSPQGLGLVSISERVRLVGGTVSMVTELNHGTRLHVEVPANGLAAGPAADESGPYEASAS